MDQLIWASLFHTHYWYKVGMLKVPPVYVAGWLVAGLILLMVLQRIFPRKPPEDPLKGVRIIDKLSTGLLSIIWKSKISNGLFLEIDASVRFQFWEPTPPINLSTKLNPF